MTLRHLLVLSITLVTILTTTIAITLLCIAVMNLIAHFIASNPLVLVQVGVQLVTRLGITPGP